MTLKDYAAQASTLLTAARKDDLVARQRLRKYFPNLDRWSPIQAKFVIAREAGFTGWPALRKSINDDITCKQHPTKVVP